MVAHVSYGRLGQRVKRIGWILRNQHGIRDRGHLEVHETRYHRNSNMRMSLEVFAPSLVKHMSDRSERHACKMLDATTGTHMFRSLPLIKPAVWKSVQKFNVQRFSSVGLSTTPVRASNGSISPISCVRLTTLIRCRSPIWSRNFTTTVIK